MDYYIKKARNKLNKIVNILVELNNLYYSYIQ